MRKMLRYAFLHSILLNEFYSEEFRRVQTYIRTPILGTEIIPAHVQKINHYNSIRFECGSRWWDACRARCVRIQRGTGVQEKHSYFPLLYNMSAYVGFAKCNWIQLPMGGKNLLPFIHHFGLYILCETPTDK